MSFSRQKPKPREEGNPSCSLPEEFLLRMEKQLGEQYPAFVQSFERKRSCGLRIQLNKITPEEFERICPFPIRRIPWIPGGYFYEEGTRPSQCPLYQAGLYYLQDPGAMVPASLLPVFEGEKVLDLCAAPGGKATALAGLLHGTGLLVANDISSSRVKALVRNLELSGNANILVLNEDPERLSGPFAGYFDKILLDAPCSGEGMFRKDPRLSSDWSPEKSKAMAKLQKRLIHLAAGMLRPGGMLLYSTCTYSREEDEEVILDLLSAHPEMKLVRPAWQEGFSPGLSCTSGISDASVCPAADPGFCVRIYPHRMESEGQFAALLLKDQDAEGMSRAEERDSGQGRAEERGPGQDRAEERDPGQGRGKGKGKPDRERRPARKASLPREEEKLIRAFFDGIGLTSLGGREIRQECLELRGSSLYYVPAELPELRGLCFARNGLFLGELKKNRFEPSMPFALALHRNDVSSCISLPVGDPRLASYLQGSPVPVRDEEADGAEGYVLLAAEGFPLAFGKLVNGQLKNKIPPGWRVRPFSS